MEDEDGLLEDSSVASTAPAVPELPPLPLKFVPVPVLLPVPLLPPLLPLLMETSLGFARETPRMRVWCWASEPVCRPAFPPSPPAVAAAAAAAGEAEAEAVPPSSAMAACRACSCVGEDSTLLPAEAL